MVRHQDGKFRSFLLAYLKNFLSEQRRKVGGRNVLQRTEVLSRDHTANPVNDPHKEILRAARGNGAGYAPINRCPPSPALEQNILQKVSLLSR
jgi:hypothetical protein